MASEAVGMDVGPTDVVFYTSLELILVSRSGLDSRWLKSMGRDVLVALMLWIMLSLDLLKDILQVPRGRNLSAVHCLKDSCHLFPEVWISCNFLQKVRRQPTPQQYVEV